MWDIQEVFNKLPRNRHYIGLLVSVYLVHQYLHTYFVLEFCLPPRASPSADVKLSHLAFIVPHLLMGCSLKREHACRGTDSQKKKQKQKTNKKQPGTQICHRDLKNK